MRFLSGVLVVLLGLSAVTMTRGRAAPPLQPGESKDVAKDIVKGAELQLSVRATVHESSESLRFQITFENVGDKDVVLNLGMMLGNGKKHLPEAVRLILTGSGDRSRKLELSGTGVAGRVDDYAVPLRAGSAYTLKMSLKDYWCPETKEFGLELKPGKYGVRAEFTGKGVQHVNADTEVLKFLNFWKGTLESEMAEFRIEKASS